MKPYYQDSLVTLYHGDALDVMRALPDASVDLIATDPPYFGVKDEEWDNRWRGDAEFLGWMGELCDEWKRLLKPIGSLYVFASPDMSHGVEVVVRERFRVLNNIRWEKDAGWHLKAEKESLLSFLSPWEAVVFAEHLPAVFGEEPDALLKQAALPLASYIRIERERAGVSRQAVATALVEDGLYKNLQTGTAMCSDWEYGDSLPPEPAWRCLQRVLGGGFLTRSHADVQREFYSLRQRYRDNRRVFNGDSSHVADIWRFPTVTTHAGKHPCEKPLPLMEHIVLTSSRPDAVVLDCFGGSGTTAEAARLNGRKCITVEEDARWCGRIADRVAQFTMDLSA